MSDVASSDYLDNVADLNENTNEEVDENLDDILLPIQDLPKVTINLLNKEDNIYSSEGQRNLKSRYSMVPYQQ